jgi:hypothetical protein
MQRTPPPAATTATRKRTASADRPSSNAASTRSAGCCLRPTKPRTAGRSEVGSTASTCTWRSPPTATTSCRVPRVYFGPRFSLILGNLDNAQILLNLSKSQLIENQPVKKIIPAEIEEVISTSTKRGEGPVHLSAYNILILHNVLQHFYQLQLP